MRSRKASRPSAHTSVAGRIDALRCACSGAIHRGVPINCEFSWEVRLSSTHLAMPKSRTFTVGASSADGALAMNTFSGFRSRCTIPSPWA